MIRSSKKIFWAVTFLAACIVAGCGYKEPKAKYTDKQLQNIPQPNANELPSPSGGLVLAVNGETLEAEDIIKAGVAASKKLAAQSSYEKFAPAVYPYIKQMLIDKVTNLLLYQKAKTTVPESVFEEDGPLDKAVDTEVRRYLANYENNYALAQKELERQGHDWNSYRQLQKKQLLAQMYFGNEIDRNPEISYSQMIEFYNSNKEEKFKREPKTKFLLIDILKEDSPQKAMEKAQKAFEDIKSGKEFEDCVVEYSEGVKAKRGGLWETADPSSLISPYNHVIAEIDQMENGDVSGIIETEGHFFIVKLIENTKGGYIPFTGVQEDIERYLQNAERKEQMDKLLSDLFEQADITGLEGFLQYCIQQVYLRSNAE